MTELGRLRCRGSLGLSLELEGDFHGLSQFAEWLTRGEIQTLTIAPTNEPPDPYAQWFNQINVIPRSDAFVLIDAADDLVTITGSQEKIEILAKNVRNFARDPEGLGNHMHISYYPGHFYLAADSLETVVSRLSD